MRFFHFITFVLFFVLHAGTAMAEAPQGVHAIAMQGTPRYAAGAPHVDYANPNAPQGGTLRQAMVGTFDTLNPFTLKGKPAQGLEYVYDRLAVRVWDEPFTLYGLIAARMIVPADRSAITFILNPKARFHDGKPITAGDVAFSFETLKKSGRPNMRRVYGLVSKVTIINPRTIKFKLGEGHDRETVMILAMMPVLPKHIWAGRAFDETTLTLPVVGSGPYRVTAVDAGRSITLERVKHDWAADHFSRKGHYNFDRLVFDYYRDDAVALEAFKAKAFDLRREFDVARWQTAYTPLPQGMIRAELEHGRPEPVRGFIFNLRRPLFADGSVRKALSLAFDAEFINRSLYRGSAKRISSLFPNTALAAPVLNTQTLSRRDALKQADALLNTAGWVIRDGARVNAKTGAPFRFQILLSSANDEKIALAFMSGLKRLGITPTIRTVDAAQFTGALTSFDFDMVLHQWVNTLSPGSEQMIYWGCEAASAEGSRNFSGICTMAIDKAARAVAQAKTQTELVSAAQTLDKLVMDAYIIVPLFTLGRDYWAYWQGLGRPDTTPIYGAVIETWWREPTKAQ